MNTTKFSVIVPVFNTVSYLHRCIDSILNQGYKNLEVILVDDGSTDDSGSICDEYAVKDNRIKVIHKQNEGQAEARNVGILAATGEYIETVDSDDYLQPDTFSTFDNAIQRHPEVEIFTGGLKEIYTHRKNVRSLYINDEIMSGYQFLKYRVRCDKYLLVGPYLYIVRKAFLVDNNLFFVKGLLLEDYLWSRQLFLSASKVLTLDFLHYNYVIRYGSTMHSKNKAILGEYRIMIIKLLEQEYTRVDDEELLRFLHNEQVTVFMKAFMELRGSNKWNKNKHLFNKKLIKGRAITAHNKYKVFLYSIHPCVYYWVTKSTRYILGIKS